MQKIILLLLTIAIKCDWLEHKEIRRIMEEIPDTVLQRQLHELQKIQYNRTGFLYHNKNSNIHEIVVNRLKIYQRLCFDTDVNYLSNPDYEVEERHNTVGFFDRFRIYVVTMSLDRDGSDMPTFSWLHYAYE